MLVVSPSDPLRFFVNTYVESVVNTPPSVRVAVKRIVILACFTDAPPNVAPFAARNTRLPFEDAVPAVFVARVIPLGREEVIEAVTGILLIPAKA